MKSRFALFLVVLSMFCVRHAYAAEEIQECLAYPAKIIELLEKVEGELPVVPEANNNELTSLYHDHGLPNFYKYKNKPFFYLWLLRTEIGAVKKNAQSMAGSEGMGLALAPSGFLSLHISNARVAWAEYARSSSDEALTESKKEEVSMNLFAASGFFSLYLSCLAQHLKSDP
ncbi:MAG: hypothetical protein KDI61_02945 [Alphaproteobacteria bacterium]|nr:hypothetical protein [Alphaproteobacteria bacterium]MCB1839208.1 hypothetical protein [Alphaproteobacteria bacterium]